VATSLGLDAFGRDADRRRVMVRAAWLYYKDGLTQAQIAEDLHLSRASVGRVLDAARAEGIVRFEISTEHLAAFELSRDLCARHGLAEAVVIPRIPGDEHAGQINVRLAQAAAEHLQRFLRPDAVIGVGWGDTVMRVLFALPRPSLRGVTIAAIAGGIDVYTREVMARHSNGVHEHLQLIPAPLVAESAAAAAAMRGEPSVTRVLDLAESAVATMTGIGAADASASSVRAGLYTEEQVRRFREMGAVGDMLGEWFDREGEIVREATSDRRIGISIERLRTLPNVIGVAGGTDKVEAIAGALDGGYLDVLVTDEDVAEALLAR
jgi:lsr operon transcriptional repressor